MQRTLFLRSSVASLPSWAANYLKRMEGEECSSSELSSATVVSPQQPSKREKSHLTSSVSSTEANAINAAYQDARESVLKHLRVLPFSSAHITGESATREEKLQLRGLSYEGGMQPQIARTLSTTQSNSTDSEKMDEVEMKSQAESLQDSPQPINTLSSSEAAPTPCHWPSLDQLIVVVKRHIAKNSSFWDPHRQARRTLSSTASSNAPAGSLYAKTLVTPSNLYVNLPGQLGSFPMTLLTNVVEYAVLHAWRGGAHVYPNGRFPDHTTAFPFTLYPRTTAADLASSHWSRDEAAHFLLSVLRHSCIQKSLRQRLWSAVQRYHRDILKDVESLSHSHGSGGAGERVIELRGGDGQRPPLTVALDELTRDVFTFPQHLYYTVKPLYHASPDTAAPEKVVLQPLHSSHWFHFTSTNSDVMTVLSERPHTHLFLYTSSSSSSPSEHANEMVDGNSKKSSNGSGETSKAGTEKTKTTQEQLWLLLSEMARLRYLVSYLLHLEAFLFKIRAAGSESDERSKAENKRHRSGLDAATRQAAQEARDAAYMDDVFHFLDLQPQLQLQRRTHNRRFLNKYKMELKAGQPKSVPRQVLESGKTAKQAVATQTSCSSSLPRIAETFPSACFASVQEVFTAFTRALDGHTTPAAEPQTTPGQQDRISTMSSSQQTNTHSTSQRRKAKLKKGEKLSDVKTGEVSEGLSAEDAALLAAIRAPRVGIEMASTGKEKQHHAKRRDSYK